MNISDLAQLRHLYANLKNGGVRDTAQAKRIADSLLAPIIERLEQAAPKAAPTPLSDDTERLEWLLWKLPGDALRYVVGELSDTSSGAEFRAAIDAAIVAQGGKV